MRCLVVLPLGLQQCLKVPLLLMAHGNQLLVQILLHGGEGMDEFLEMTLPFFTQTESGQM